MKYLYIWIKLEGGTKNFPFFLNSRVINLSEIIGPKLFKLFKLDLYFFGKELTYKISASYMHVKILRAAETEKNSFILEFKKQNCIKIYRIGTKYKFISYIPMTHPYLKTEMNVCIGFLDRNVNDDGRAGRWKNGRTEQDNTTYPSHFTSGT